MIFRSGLGLGRSCMKRLNKEGESIAPCGTPLYRRLIDEIWCLCVTLHCLSARKLVIHFFSFLCRVVSKIFCDNICLGTVSKALLMSIATSIVLSGGDF